MRSLMTTVIHLPICAIDRCYALFDDYRHLNQAQFLNALSPRVAAAGVCARRRRHHHHHHLQLSRPASTWFVKTKRRMSQNQHQHPHPHPHHGTRLSLSKIIKRPLDMAYSQEIRRRSSAADCTSLDSSVIASAMNTFVSPDRPSPPPPLTTAHNNINLNHDVTPNRQQSNLNRFPGPPFAEHTATVLSSSHSRSNSSSSRMSNRLSFTLPIALPTSDPSRPVASRTTSTLSSMPSTPQDSFTMPSPSNVNEFIIAIAAKERKVLELREELAREEAELALLKKRFSPADTIQERGAIHQLNLGGSRAVTPTAVADTASSRHSVDFERRTQFIPNQETSTHGRRRVIQGGHTRTLSLLSRARANSDFSLLDQRSTDGNGRSLTMDQGLNHASDQALPKRASWQPRSQQSSPIVPQIVEDFKLGLRAFVEDIRQITIGDEPINGQSSQRSPNTGHYRSASLSQGMFTEFGRPRPVQQRVSPATASNPGTAPPTPTSKQSDGVLEKPRPAKSKHFSWTPLGFDSMDDIDWANWESPVPPTKSTRWSGSTINSGVMVDIHSIPENAELATTSTPINSKSNIETPVLSPNKLEELLPNVVNRLSPSNLKRTANNLLDEWEKSLVIPSKFEVTNKENIAS